MPVGEAVDDLPSGLFETVENAVRGVGGFLVKQEGVEDAGPVFEVVGNNVNQVRGGHDVLDQSSRGRSLGVKVGPLKTKLKCLVPGESAT